MLRFLHQTYTWHCIVNILEQEQGGNSRQDQKY